MWLDSNTVTQTYFACSGPVASQERSVYNKNTGEFWISQHFTVNWHSEHWTNFLQWNQWLDPLRALACEADGVPANAVAAAGRGRGRPGHVVVNSQLEEKSKHLIFCQLGLLIDTSKHSNEWPESRGSQGFMQPRMMRRSTADMSFY